MIDGSRKQERTIEALRRGSLALPGLRAWAADLLSEHAHAARPIAERGFARLADYFPRNVLNETLVVSVPRVPFPLVECGYAHSPFEALTYDLQHQFERGVPLPDLVQRIAEHALQTRAWAAHFYQRLGVPIGG